MEKFEHFIPKEIIKRSQPLKDYTTFGIGGNCLSLLLPRNKKELVKCIDACKKLNKKFQVLGNGSNILASSKNCKRVFIVTTKMENGFLMQKNSVVANAGAMLGDFIMWCKEQGLSGPESLYGIPATIGGAVMMNAGAFGSQVFDFLEEVEVYNNGKIETLKKNQIEHLHHYTSLLQSGKVILSARFNFERLAPSVIFSKIKEVITKRQQTQPHGKSAGCVFRANNCEPAGKIIDELGLKGLRVGGAVVSEKHANFIINDNYATDQDVKDLIKKIQSKVYALRGIKLEREIEYIGDRDDYYR